MPNTPYIKELTILIPAVTPKSEVTRFMPNTSAEYSAPFIMIFARASTGFASKTSTETVRAAIRVISTALIFFNLLFLSHIGKASSEYPESFCLLKKILIFYLGCA